MALTADTGRDMSRALIDRYFRSVQYPYTRHHIDSYDQFMQQDLVSIIKTQNPILILKDLIDEATNTYAYKVEVFIGGEDGSEIEIGTPTVALQGGNDVRLLFPNEARLRNLTYASSVYANIKVKIQYNTIVVKDGVRKIVSTELPRDTIEKFELFKIPIMLHSRYCVLHGKPREFLTEAGECHYDNGGYFIVDGAEKVLITRQEQAFNTLYITPQASDPQIKIYASISCLSPKTRMVKRVAFFYLRNRDTIQVQLPFIRRPVPLFVMFRALGFQSDEEILRIIFPDFDAPEAKLLMDKLQPSILESYPFMNTYTAVQYIKTLTKGFSEVHVLDIIRNQTFTHMPNDAMSQAIFMGDCVRKILRVNEGYDSPTDRDDTRNQRCLVSGFLVQMLFSGVYATWRKAVSLAIDEEYNYNKGTLYKNENFVNIFDAGNIQRIFRAGQMSDGIMRGFRGKWGSGMGEEKTGVLQALSRLSYCDFMSHCRRVILDFDTGMKLTGPRKLHTSQYGYFCTSETPTGASIGITKNLTIMAAISTATQGAEFLEWMRGRGNCYPATELSIEQRAAFVPVYVNGGMFGYTARPKLLVDVCKLFKRTGCLPYSASITFSIRDRRVYIYIDEGRPLRPLIWLEEKGDERISLTKLQRLKEWRDLVMGTLDMTKMKGLDSTTFTDPLAGQEGVKLEKYIEILRPHTGCIEYIDPYEQNEAFIANYPDYIKPQTTHIEVHPSTILSLMTSQIPFPQHNQSPRNQLSCSQSKQGVSYYATNWQNRFDNTAHVLCYGEAPLTRSMYSNYLGEGKMPYGMNCVLAIATWTGYNQEDGIVMNGDAIERGMFRTVGYRSYEAFEEDDEMAKTRTRFANPLKVAAWKDLGQGLDYSKLDENGVIRVGEYVDENTVIVGAYMVDSTGQIRDASVTPQVWTRGRVEKIALTYGNNGLRLIKIRVVQDRKPELGDKFSNRHGQKGTIGALLRGHDMPRTSYGLVPDMIMNPHAIPSRMTIAQNLEQLFGKVAGLTGTIADATAFMNDGSPEDQIGTLLSAIGFERYGNEILYNGATGEQIPAYIFIGPVYGMRLKHMVEDKWQARGKGRREQRTHQPTGGRGAQGGLKIGEMDRDAIAGHSMAAFFKESFMERSDGSTMPICVSCGLEPIFNPKLGISICPMCDGPVRFAGDTINNLELLPPIGRPKSKIVQVQIPYATKLLGQELETYLNMGMRYITTADVQRLEQLEMNASDVGEERELKPIILPEVFVAEKAQPVRETTITIEQLKAMGADTSKLEGTEILVQDGSEEMVQEAELGEEEETFEAGNGEVFGGVGGGAAGLAAGNELIIPEGGSEPEGAFMPETGFSSMHLAPPQTGVAKMPAPIPGAGPTLAIDTSAGAMEQEGLFQSGGRVHQPRSFRRAPVQGGLVPGRVEMGEGGERIELKPSTAIVVNKLG